MGLWEGAGSATGLGSCSGSRMGDTALRGWARASAAATGLRGREGCSLPLEGADRGLVAFVPEVLCFAGVIGIVARGAAVALLRGTFGGAGDFWISRRPGSETTGVSVCCEAGAIFALFGELPALFVISLVAAAASTTEVIGRDSSVASGSGLSPPTTMGDIMSLGSTNFVVLTPQSSRSGRLSSSSPAQSMWLPGVVGRLSAIATARTRSTRASMFVRMSKDVISGAADADRCGGVSLGAGVAGDECPLRLLGSRRSLSSGTASFCAPAASGLLICCDRLRLCGVRAELGVGGTSTEGDEGAIDTLGMLREDRLDDPLGLAPAADGVAGGLSDDGPPDAADLAIGGVSGLAWVLSGFSVEGSPEAPPSREPPPPARPGRPLRPPLRPFAPLLVMPRKGEPGSVERRFRQSRVGAAGGVLDAAGVAVEAMSSSSGRSLQTLETMSLVGCLRHLKVNLDGQNEYRPLTLIYGCVLKDVNDLFVSCVYMLSSK